MTTSVRAPVDLRMLFGIHDVDRADEMYGEIEMEVAVTGDLTPEQTAAVRSYPARSPVYTLVAMGHPIRPNVDVETGA